MIYVSLALWAIAAVAFVVAWCGACTPDTSEALQVRCAAAERAKRHSSAATTVRRKTA